MGYAGGTTQNPNYGNIGDHTETVQIDYDPERITYAELCALFWESHTPTSRRWGRQYRNAVFYHNADQRRQALESKAALEQKIDETVHTEIVPIRSFTWAEEYHQKYLLKSRPELARKMMRIYPDKRDFNNSTAVARLNGYVGGNGSRKQLRRDIGRLGLDERGQERLMRLVRH